MKKSKMKAGVFFQESAVQPDNSPSFLPLRDLDYTPIVVRPQGSPKKRGPVVLKILTDEEINSMDERNAEVEEMTCEFIMKLIDEDGATPDDLGLDAEIVSAVLDVFEQTLSEFGFYINRPTIIQADDGEHIVRSMFDDEPVDVSNREFVRRRS